MTQEEKAQRYDEAIKKAESLYKYSEPMSGCNVIIETLFPELKESEDERIRKELIQFFSDKDEEDYEGLHPRVEIIAWLENQGEVVVDKELSDLLNKVICHFINEPNIPYSERDEVSKKIIPYVKQLEKQGEQKPFNYEDANIQQKDFAQKSALEAAKEEKVDNVITIDPKEYSSIDPYFTKPADKVEPFDKYEGLTDFEGTLADICIGWIGEEYGWKQYIKDNADVLLGIAIKKFNSVQDAPSEQKPAWSEEDEKFFKAALWHICNSISNGTSTDILSDTTEWLKSLKERVQPQPKQEWSEEDETNIQRALFYVNFYQTHEADTKESGECFDWLSTLKDRVQPQPKKEWSEEDEKYVKDLVGYFAGGLSLKHTEEDNVEWLKSLKDRVLPQPKQEWSEDDEVKINRIVACLENLNVADNDILLKDVAWLKSLRPQNTWKPSERQKEALLWCVVHLGGADKQALGELLEELNKL